MAVDQALIDEALAALGVTEIRPLRNGGQKTVLLVDRNGEEFVLKIIAIESGETHPDEAQLATLRLLNTLVCKQSTTGTCSSIPKPAS